MSEFELRDVLPDLEGTGRSELHAMIERAHQIEAMTGHPGWPLLRDYLTALTTTNQTYILNGSCKTIEEYRERTGYVRGLRAAMDAPRALLERVGAMQEALDGSSL